MKKKILFIIDYAYSGGAEKVLQNIVNYLDKDKYDITIVTRFEEKDFYKYYPEYVRHITYTYIRPDQNASFIQRCIGVLRRNIVKILNLKEYKVPYDTVVAMKDGPQMKKALKFKNASRYVAWIHTDYSVMHWAGHFFRSDEEEVECMSKFSKVVCVAKTVKDSVIKVVGDPGNLIVKYNPLNTDDIRIKANEKVEPLWDKRGTLFVSVGRLEPAKSYNRLLNICKRLNEEGYIFEVCIVGDGECRKRLLEQKRELELDNVYFAGSKDNPYPYIKAAGWFVCSSLYEGFSTVLQEAAILSIPIITTECSGARELLGDSEYGIITENSEEALYAGMKKILEDKTVTEHYSGKIKEIQDSISLEERMSEIEALF